MNKNLIAGAALLTLFASSLGFVHIRKMNIIPKETRITFVSPFANANYWGRTAKGITEAAAASDTDVKCIGFTELNAAKQVNSLQSAVWSDVDGIITAGIKENNDLLQAIRSAQEHNIPVILIDSDVPESNRTCYVGTDNFKAGQTAGESMADACGGSGKIVVIVSYLDNQNQMERVEGFYDALSSYPDMEVDQILEGESNAIYLRDKIIKILEDDPAITGVFCAEGYSSRSMVQLKMDAPGQLSYLKLVGFDLDAGKTDAIKDGTIDAIINQDASLMGQVAVEQLMKAIRGEKNLEDCYIDPACIRQENADDLENYPESDIEWHIY